MGVDEPYPAAHEPAVLDESEHLLMVGHRHPGQPIQEVQYILAGFQVSTSQLAYHHRVDQYTEVVQQVCETRLAEAQMVYPDRGVGQDQADSPFRRGAGDNPGSLPPSLANLRALSRSTRARRPSARRADRDSMPVSRPALSNNPSSIVTVVLMMSTVALFDDEYCAAGLWNG